MRLPTSRPPSLRNRPLVAFMMNGLPLAPGANPASIPKIQESLRHPMSSTQNVAELNQELTVAQAYLQARVCLSSRTPCRHPEQDRKRAPERIRSPSE